MRKWAVSPWTWRLGSAADAAAAQVELIGLLAGGAQAAGLIAKLALGFVQIDVTTKLQDAHRAWRQTLRKVRRNARQDRLSTSATAAITGTGNFKRGGGTEVIACHIVMIRAASKTASKRCTSPPGRPRSHGQQVPGDDVIGRHESRRRHRW